MNILFFLSPKQDLMYVYDDFTLRQTLEKWENNRYASIPVLNRKGEYVGTLTEGDILWGLKKFHGLDLEAAEDIPIRDFAHKRDYKAVTVTTSMDQLIEAAMNQNFVPDVDDRGMVIGSVRRQAIIDAEHVTEIIGNRWRRSTARQLWLYIEHFPSQLVPLLWNGACR